MAHNEEVTPTPTPAPEPTLWHTALYAYQADAVADLIRAVERVLQDPAVEYLDSYTRFMLKGTYEAVVLVLGGDTDGKTNQPTDSDAGAIST